MYSNVDTLINKKHELDTLLASLSVKPQIISLTEVNYKNKEFDYELHEMTIPGYVMYHNILNTG